MKRLFILLALLTLVVSAGVARVSTSHTCGMGDIGCIHADGAEGQEVMGDALQHLSCSACGAAESDGDARVVVGATPRCAFLDRMHSDWLDGPDPFPPKRLARS